MEILSKLPVLCLISAISILALSSCHGELEDELALERGAMLLSERRFSEAESIFRKQVLRHEECLQKLRDNTAAGGDSYEQSNQAKLLAGALKDLSITLSGQGKYAEAEGNLNEALAIYRKYFGKQNKFCAECFNSLAVCFYKQGKLYEAEHFYVEELELQKKLLEHDNLHLAVTANNLAAICQRLGDYEGAEKYFQWALKIAASRSDADDQEKLADILNNFAIFYEKTSDISSAQEMVQKALSLESNLKGTDAYVYKVRSLLVLAGIEKSSDPELSEGHYKEALSIVDSKLGGKAELLAEALEKYAELLLAERDFDEAEAVFRRSLDVCRRAYGSEHPAYAERLSEYALLLRRKSSYVEAEKLLRQALSIQEKTVGVDTLAFLSTLHRLAAVLSDQKRYLQADQLYEENLPKLKAKLGTDHPYVADTLDNRALYAERAGQKEEAYELRASARLIRRKIAGSLNSDESRKTPLEKATGHS